MSNRDKTLDAQETSDNQNSGYRRRRWYHRRDFRFIGLVVVFVLLFQAYGYLTGPSRIGDKLNQVLEAG